MIPNKAHFIWTGQNFPWLYYVAVVSAAYNGAFEKITVHHKNLGPNEKWFPLLTSLPQVEISEMDYKKIFSSKDGLLDKLGEQFKQIDNNPVIETDILRYAILYKNGGVYMDFDVLVLRPLTTLLQTNKSAFLGQEKILFPKEVVYPKSLRQWFKKQFCRILVRYRNYCERKPYGYRKYRAEWLYVPTVNGAIQGAEKTGAFHNAAISRINDFDKASMNVLLNPGPYLLQDAVKDIDLAKDVEIFPPNTFYPISPGITKHLFKSYSNVNLEQEWDLSDTIILHWYSASFRGQKNGVMSVDETSLTNSEGSIFFLEILKEFVPQALKTLSVPTPQ